MKKTALLFNLLSTSLLSYAASEPPAWHASICGPAQKILDASRACFKGVHYVIENRDHKISLHFKNRKRILEQIPSSQSPALVGLPGARFLPETLQPYRENGIFLYTSSKRTNAGSASGQCGSGAEMYLHVLDLTREPQMVGKHLISSCAASIELSDQNLSTDHLGELAVEEGRLGLRFLIHGDKDGTIAATLSDDYKTLEFNRAPTSAKSQQTSTETPKPSMTFEPSGTIYPNSCTPVQLDSLGKALAEHSVPEPRSLLRLITVLMCEPRSFDRMKFARAHLPSTLKEVEDSADGTPSVTLVRSRKEVLESGLFAEGHAWGAELDSTNTKVRLSYYQSEACLAGRTFTFAKARWMLTELSAACD